MANMKLRATLKRGFTWIGGLGAFVGLVVFFYAASKRESSGYYTAQDTLSSYQKGYSAGRDSLRRYWAIEKSNYAVKACQ